MSWKKHLPRLLGTAIVIGFGVAVVMLIRNFMDAEPQQTKKTVQQITLLKPPPPPPPPPKVEKPPEPEMKQEKVELPDPETPEELPEMADEPPAGDQLGLDADGGAGGDGFGLIGRKGGRGLLSGAGDPNVMYAATLKNRIEEILLNADELRRQAYSVDTSIWVDDRGRVLRVELARGSGDRKLDDLLLEKLSAADMSLQAPPADMPQPVKLRITMRL